jgi:hypothetical protein
VTGDTYNDTSVSNGDTYYYEVEGVDSMGTGSPSNEVSATPVSSGGPPAPTLGVTSTATSVNLSWSPATGANTYVVLRGSSSGTETAYATNVTGTTYDDTNVTSGNTYYYEVEGVNSVGTAGSPSNEVTGKLTVASGGGPAAPGSLSATVISSGVLLMWNASTGATTYDVFRGSTYGGESSTPLATKVSSAYYIDTNISPGSTYYYDVEAVSSGGAVGSPSNQAEAVIASHITASISKSCSANTCTFTSKSTDAGGTITTYSWTTTGGSGTGSSFSHTFTSTGTYTVTLTVYDNKGSDGGASVNVSCTSPSSSFRFSSQLTCS